MANAADIAEALQEAKVYLPNGSASVLVPRVVWQMSADAGDVTADDVSRAAPRSIY